MNKLLKYSAVASVCALIGCGGQAISKPLNICLQPSNGPVPMEGCDASLLSATSRDPATFVAQQAATPGPMILFLGRKDDIAWTVQHFPTIVDEAKRYGNKFGWAYYYDEIGWCKTGLCWFADEELVLSGIRYGHGKGIKALVTILPEVILDPRFQLKSINEYDGISLDVYHSIRPGLSVDLKGCRFNGDEASDLAYCAGQKLRSLDYRNQLGLIYQAFKMQWESPQVVEAYLTKQRMLIDNAAAMGFSATAAFGCELGPREMAEEPIEPLCRTQWKPLVMR